MQKNLASIKHQKRKSYQGLLLITPVILILVLIIFLPTLWALKISFYNYRLGEPEMTFVGFRNYVDVLMDSDFLWAFWRNIIFVICSVSAQMLLGLGISLLLAKGFPLQRVWLALIIAPMAISPAVSAVIWRYIFDFNIGPLNYYLQVLGLKRQLWFAGADTALVSVLFVYVWGTTPGVVLMLYPARLTFPTELYEAASIDGAGKWTSFFHITLPLIKPAFTIALVFRLIMAFRAFGIVQALTEGGPGRSTEILAIYLFKRTFRYWEFGAGAAVSFVILVLTMLVASYQISRMHKNLFLLGG